MKKFLIPFLAGIAVILLIAAQPRIGTRAVMLETNGFGTNTTLVNAPSISVTQLSVLGTITSANGTLLNNMTDSWTNAGTTYEAIKMNVLKTAAAADSRLLSLEVNTNAFFRFTQEKRFQIFNTNTDATTYERGGMYWSNNIFYAGTEKGSVGGTGRDFYIITPTKQWVFSEGSGNIASAAGFDAMAFGKFGFVLRSELYSQANGTFTMTAAGAGTFSGLIFSLNTANNPALKQTGGHLFVTDGLLANSTNGLFFGNTIDTTASAGMTLNRQSGRVRVSSGTLNYFLTNNLVTTSSAVLATVNTTNATTVSVIAVPTAGLLTFKLNAAAGADCDISFLITSP